VTLFPCVHARETDILRWQDRGTSAMKKSRSTSGRTQSSRGGRCGLAGRVQGGRPPRVAVHGRAGWRGSSPDSVTEPMSLAPPKLASFSPQRALREPPKRILSLRVAENRSFVKRKNSAKSHRVKSGGSLSFAIERRSGFPTVAGPSSSAGRRRRRCRNGCASAHFSPPCLFHVAGPSARPV
jgi:hypothetical protein